ncbi:hypothetical protein Tco_1198688, partial [Tanacetum coccineum]
MSYNVTFSTEDITNTQIGFSRVDDVVRFLDIGILTLLYIYWAARAESDATVFLWGVATEQFTALLVPAGSVVPTGKDNSIVSTGSTKVIPAGRTILLL